MKIPGMIKPCPLRVSTILLLFGLICQATLAADESDNSELEFDISALHKTRFEVLDNQFRAGLNGSDQLLTLFTSLRGEVKYKNTSIVAELIDARGYFADEGSFLTSAFVNTLEPVQAYIQHRVPLESDGEFDVQFGRFTMDIGSRRLVGRNVFRTTVNAFAGIRSNWKSSNGDVFTAFYTLPQERLPGDLDSLLDNDFEFDDQDFDQQLWGLFYQSKQLISGLTTEAYVFGLHESDDASERETRNRQLITPGVRLLKAPQVGQWDFEIEGGIQFGQQRATNAPTDRDDLDTLAGFVHAESGYTFGGPIETRVSLEFEYASGDDDPTDGNFDNFDGLFGPIRGDLGPTNLYTLIPRTNLISPGLRVELNTGKRWDAMVGWRAAFLAASRSPFGNTGVVDLSGESSRYAGQQLEFRARYWLWQDRVRFETGAAFFFQGDFFDTAPNVNGEGDPAYYYSDLHFYF